MSRSWFVLLLLVSSLAFAQGRPSYTTPGVWKAWDWDFGNGGPVGSAATRAEVKSLADKVMELRALLMASPVVAKPVGFNAMLGGHFNEFLVPERRDLKGRDYPISAGLVFGAFPQEWGDDGRVEWGETALMWVELNQIPRWPSLAARDWRDITTDVVLHPLRYKNGFAGLPRFGDTLVLKNNPKLLWTPVTLDETLRLVVAQRTKDVGDFEDGLGRVKKEHAAWIAGRAERQQIQKDLAPKQKDPDTYLAQAAALERQEDENYQRLLKEMTPAANQLWAATIARLREAEQDLASLWAEQKTTPACLLEKVEDTKLLARFVAATTPGCRPVIRPNWDYFDRSLPRSAIQLITIINRCMSIKTPAGDPDPAGCPTNNALLESLDWNKVRALMDR